MTIQCYWGLGLPRSRMGSLISKGSLSATMSPQKWKSLSNYIFEEPIQSRNTRPNLLWPTPLWKILRRWALKLCYITMMYVTYSSKLQQPLQSCHFGRLKNVSCRPHRKAETFTEDNTQEALLYICHFLWKQSKLGNMQQTQAWPHSRTGNALTVERQ